MTAGGPPPHIAGLPRLCYVVTPAPGPAGFEASWRSGFIIFVLPPVVFKRVFGAYTFVFGGYGTGVYSAGWGCNRARGLVEASGATVLDRRCSKSAEGQGVRGKLLMRRCQHAGC